MKEIILIITYTLIFIAQIILIRLSLKKQRLSLWIITYGVEIITIISALILMIYYLQPNSYNSQSGNENLYIFIAFNIYSITFFITYIIGTVLKYKKKHLKSK